MRFALAISLALLLSPAAFAQTASDVDVLTKKEQAARDKTKQLEAERQEVRKDISSLKQQLSKTAREAQSVEAELSALESQTEELTSRAASLQSRISADKAKYTELLAALQRLEATPPPTLALSPRDAREAAMAGRLMANLSAQLKERAEALALNLTALDVTQSQLVIKQAELGTVRDRLRRRQAEVETGLKSKGQLEAKLSDERSAAAKEADRLAAESKSLLDLIAKLEAEAMRVVPRAKPGRGAAPAAPVTLPKGTKRFAEAKGGMIRPVSGQIIKKYGRGEKGLTIAGRANGQVLAPYAGRVEFSGPFKNYDNVIILNVGDGYFVLLTGLERLNVGAGDDVRRGEPVGALPGDSQAEIYIELRKNGSPVDPAPWLAPNDVKSG